MGGQRAVLFARAISFSVQGEVLNIRGRGLVFNITQRPIPEEFLALEVGDNVSLYRDEAESGVETDYEIGGIERLGDGKKGTAFVLRQETKSTEADPPVAPVAMMSNEKNEPLDSPDQVIRDGDTIAVDLWYPRSNGHVKYIEVGLCDVRAADSIRVHYDFDRDGYVIEQASTFEWASDDETCDLGWKEVAFVQAWARQAPPVADTSAAPVSKESL